jgi:hypothetical protein
MSPAQVCLLSMPPATLRLSPALRPPIADEEGEAQREEAGGETFAGAAFGRPTVGDRLCTG